MIIIPNKTTKCSNCIWATYFEADCVLASGYLCKKNPFKPIAMGLNGTHADRKRHIEDEKEDRKQKK